MIAWACIKNYQNKKSDLFFKAQARMNIDEVL